MPAPNMNRTVPDRPDEGYCVGMDVPRPGSRTAEDARFWTGSARYQPWKDVAAFFKENPNGKEE